ncbi:hypothetical protein [Streptomyces torulosus]|uniref:MmyB family transcriptional regulator n=1 Tax=Streptomyces torulosus TaxID=68276 RepID=UPI000AB5607F|nr:hypothetical protein [Streptomyces torulosus]
MTDALGRFLAGLSYRALPSAVPAAPGHVAAHDVRSRHEGVKRLRHPEVGGLDLAYRALDLPLSPRVVHDLTLYTAEPGTASEDRLRLLAGWAATQPAATEPTATRPAPTEPTRHRNR